MSAAGKPLDCVVFILCDGKSVLAEKRRADKVVAPGLVCLPGGHVDPGETIEAALARELMEELDVGTDEPRFICTLPYDRDAQLRLHYFAVERWNGTIRKQEAEALLWIPLNDLSRLDLQVDRDAVAAYQKRKSR